MLKNWLKIYWYNTMKHKMYFLLTVIGLAIGLSAVIISYLYYTEEMSYDTWHKDSDRVFMVETKFSEEESWPMLSYPFGSKLKEISPEVEAYSYVDNSYDDGMLVHNGELLAYTKAISVQSNFFTVFPFEIVSGSQLQPFDAPNQAYIKDTYVEYLFKDKDPIGQTIVIWDVSYVVKGIFKEANTLSSINPNIVMNDLDEREKEAVEKEYWGNYNSALWIKVKEAQSKEIIEKRLLDIYDEYVMLPEANKKGISVGEYKRSRGEHSFGFYLHDLKGQRFVKIDDINALPEGKANVDRIYIAIGLSVLIILLSVFNYINITTVQVMNRGKEVGMRKTFGANRLSLIYQNYFESTITVLISIVLSFVIVEFSLPSLRVFFEAQLSFNILDFIFQLIVFLVLVVTLVGTLPAFYISSFKTIDVLKGNMKRSKKGVWFKNILLTVQFIVACFFIIGSFVIYQQVSYMLKKDLGYNADQIVAVKYNFKKEVTNRLDVYERLKKDVLKLKNIEGVSACLLDIGGYRYVSSGFSYKEKDVQPGIAAIDYDFLELYQIEMKEGRMLSKDLASDSIQNVLINEKAMSLMGELEPIGQNIKWNGGEHTIVGVVKNFNLIGLKADYRPLLFVALSNNGWGKGMKEMSIKIKANKAEETMKAIEEVWKKHNISDLPFTYEFVDKRFAQSFERSLQERNVFLVLNSLVVFIALFGLYSLASFTINSRLKEVAIRKVLGARPKDLIQKLTGQYIVFCLIGFGIAVFPSYYFLNKWLSDYAFRIEMSVWPFIFCFVIIIILTLLIVISRAFKATRVDVLKYIKYE
ncbi:ABC transporter permease [Myroides odoratimimus]|uniref:ABC transporter permease n=1 Tax=Myroides odoratimimus TaxID=76832 RepID=UPI002097BC9B|nr:ABC transporter permease [Myroides odoratimimus]MCO7722120.1 ABC transporter permease [Myroides odoratimimus]